MHQPNHSFNHYWHLRLGEVIRPSTEHSTTPRFNSLALHETGLATESNGFSTPHWRSTKSKTHKLRRNNTCDPRCQPRGIVLHTAMNTICGERQPHMAGLARRQPSWHVQQRLRNPQSPRILLKQPPSPRLPRSEKAQLHSPQRCRA